MTKRHSPIGLIIGLLLLAACRPGYRQAYDALQTRDFAAARPGFERFKTHRHYRPLATYHLAVLDYRSSDYHDLPELGRLDARLAAADTLLAAVSPRRRARWQARYNLNDSSALELRAELQQRALVQAELLHTVTALDSLRTALPRPLIALAPRFDALRVGIVNEALDATDYDEITALLRRHLGVVRPENYPRSRRLGNRLLTAFVEKYGWCRLDSFAAAHPYQFFSRDCWCNEAQTLLCNGNYEALLQFRAQNPWTATEPILAQRILEKTDPAQEVALSATAAAQLVELRRRELLRDRLRDERRQDTAAILSDLQTIIRINAPRFSAFQLLDEGLQVLLQQRAYTSATRLLADARPYFSDTLPENCHTNFDFQLRVRPYIDGKLPILRRPLQNLYRQPLDNLNTPEGDEFSAVITGNGSELFFAAANRPDNQAGIDIYRAERAPQGVSWIYPQIVPELSGPGDQVPLSITADGREMLLRMAGRLHLAQRRTDGVWSRPQAVGIAGLPLIGNGSLSADGRLLLIEGAYSSGDASTPPDLDLFVCFRDTVTGAWSSPVALGPSINSDGTEGRPLLTPDNRTLYFISDGFPGLGRTDVFRARRLGEGWSRWTYPENLGKEINDTQAHPGLSALFGASAIISRGEENRDLWEIELPKP